MSDTFYINKARNKIIISSVGPQGVAGPTGATGAGATGPAGLTVRIALPERVSIS